MGAHEAAIRHGFAKAAAKREDELDRVGTWPLALGGLPYVTMAASVVAAAEGSIGAVQLATKDSQEHVRQASVEI